MNAASRLICIIFFLFSSFSLAAATIFTAHRRYVGKIVAEDNDSVTIRDEIGSEASLSRSNILTIYDDNGALVWSHPSIAKQDSAPNGKERIEIQQSDANSPYKGLHIGLTGGAGIGYGNATFSTYPLGYGPDYRLLLEASASAAWYHNPQGALTLGAGYSARTIPVRGLIAANLGTQGNGYWPMQFVDFRVGYRFQSDIFFVELGLLGAVKTRDAQVSIETASSTVSGDISGIAQKSFFALSLAVGANIPVNGQIFLVGFARVDHAVTPVISGDTATAISPSNQVLSSAPLSLVLLTFSGQLGVGWRLW